MKKKDLERGFSLIELMMVVVIIGVLAGMGIPQYKKFQMKSRQAEVKSLLSTMYTAQGAFKAEWNQYYADFNAVGYGLDGDVGYNVGFSGDITGPSAHPDTTYRDSLASVKDSGAFCTSSGTCNIIKAHVTTFPSGALTAVAFTFAGRANLDEDPNTDDWTIDETKHFAQVRDDIAN